MNAAGMVRWGGAVLDGAGLGPGRREAWLLLRALSGIDAWLRPEVPVPPEAEAAYRAAVARRAAREPFAYVVGRRFFRGIELAVDRRALIPRPETEGLVEQACALLPRGGLAVDLCTGSGAVALAIAAERPDARGVATDLSDAALALAAANARRLGLDGRVRLCRGDLWDAVPPEARGSVDVCACNPPYVEAGEWSDLDPEVRDFEPREALVATEGWRSLYGRIARGGEVWLRAGGWLLCESAPAQAAPVAALLRGPAWDAADVMADAGGAPRIVRGRRALPPEPR